MLEMDSTLEEVRSKLNAMVNPRVLNAPLTMSLIIINWWVLLPLLVRSQTANYSPTASSSTSITSESAWDSPPSPSTPPHPSHLVPPNTACSVASRACTLNTRCAFHPRSRSAAERELVR